jgi:hypothetical protein
VLRTGRLSDQSSGALDTQYRREDLNLHALAGTWT